MIQNIISNTHARATRGTQYIYTCTLHRFYLFKCKPLCGVIVDTVLVTIKRGLNDSNAGEIIVLIESVNHSTAWQWKPLLYATLHARVWAGMETTLCVCLRARIK